MNRKQAIAKIKKAYENKELGFQKGASKCKYYDAGTDSHCAVGVLIGKKKELINKYGDILIPFKGSEFENIDRAMGSLKLETFCGLTIDELTELQRLHDDILIYNDVTYKESDFKGYLYSLQ